MFHWKNKVFITSSVTSIRYSMLQALFFHVVHIVFLRNLIMVEEICTIGEDQSNGYNNIDILKGT